MMMTAVMKMIIMTTVLFSIIIQYFNLAACVHQMTAGILSKRIWKLPWRFIVIS